MKYSILSMLADGMGQVFDQEFNALMADFSLIESDIADDKTQQNTKNEVDLAILRASQRSEKFLYTKNGTALRKYEMLMNNQHDLNVIQATNTANERIAQITLDETNATNVRIAAIVSGAVALIVILGIVSCLAYQYLQKNAQIESRARQQESQHDFLQQMQQQMRYGQMFQMPTSRQDCVLAAAPIIRTPAEQAVTVVSQPSQVSATSNRNDNW